MPYSSSIPMEICIKTEQDYEKEFNNDTFIEEEIKVSTH